MAGMRREGARAGARRDEGKATGAGWGVARASPSRGRSVARGEGEGHAGARVARTAPERGGPRWGRPHRGRGCAPWPGRGGPHQAKEEEGREEEGEGLTTGVRAVLAV
jgi:hypothetical protein